MLPVADQRVLLFCSSVPVLATQDFNKFSLTFSGNLNIAPVSGSTINNPMKPPKSKFPKYQPSNSESKICCLVESHSLVNMNVYSSPLKYPEPDFSIMLEGVTPDATIRLSSFFTSNGTPTGAVLTCTGYRLSETIEAHPLTVRTNINVNIFFMPRPSNYFKES